MRTEGKFDNFGFAAFLFAVGSIVAYGLFSDAKLIPFSSQFKIFALLSIAALCLLAISIFNSIIGRIDNLFNYFFLSVASILIVFNFYISYQTIVSFSEPSESEVASNERFKKIKSLKASNIKKISVSRYLQVHDFKNIKPSITKEGKIFVRDIENKESISEFINILQTCTFEKFPRFKPTGTSFYIALLSIDNSKIEFNVSHIKDTNNTYEISSFKSEEPIYKKHHGTAYSDRIYQWIEAIN